MIALHRPKIFSQEIAINSAAHRYSDRLNEMNELEEVHHMIPGIIYSAPDIKSSTIFETIDGPNVMSLKTRKAINKIKSYSSLEENWDGHGAVKPQNHVIERAIEFLRLADEDGIEAYFVAPGPNGEILVEFKNNQMEAEIYFNQDGASQMLIYENEECVFEGTIEENYGVLKNHLSLYAEV